MNDPKRLLGGEASEHERALLQAGASEEPPSDGAARLAAALGVALPSTPSSARAESTVRSAGGKLATKWLALAGASMLAVTSTWLLRAAPHSEHTKASRSTPPASRALNVVTQPAPRVSQASDPHPSQPPELRGSEAPDPHASSIAAEIERLERVRTRLRKRQSGPALRALDDYDALYDGGVLREEAEFMRIEALFQAERAHDATTHAQRFLLGHPHSIHAARVRALMESRDAR